MLHEGRAIGCKWSGAKEKGSSWIEPHGERNSEKEPVEASKAGVRVVGRSVGRNMQKVT